VGSIREQKLKAALPARAPPRRAAVGPGELPGIVLHPCGMPTRSSTCSTRLCARSKPYAGTWWQLDIFKYGRSARSIERLKDESRFPGYGAAAFGNRSLATSFPLIDSALGRLNQQPTMESSVDLPNRKVRRSRQIRRGGFPGARRKARVFLLHRKKDLNTPSRRAKHSDVHHLFRPSRPRVIASESDQNCPG